MTIKQLLDKHEFAMDFFNKYNIEPNQYLDLTLNSLLDELEFDFLEDNGINRETFISEFVEYIELMSSLMGEEVNNDISIKILPGINKSKENENFKELQLNQGDIIAIVGPTGSGKSRLLGDIEWAANEDTPTKRKVLINNKIVDPNERFNVGNKLVAQLSQNMNFVMDLSVKEFLELHASSRLVKNKDKLIIEIFNKANYLAGEKFKLETPITSLSGGQSRALMIADTAYLSKSPIILIDEIENAGIDRRKALEILVSNDKIVLIATHDPILALMAQKRIIISNGGIVDVIETSEEEKEMLSELEKLDRKMLKYRENMRYGKRIIQKGDV